MKVQTVDLRKDSPEEFRSNLVNSLRNTGFAVITGHGIPSWYFENCYQQWEGFFKGSETWKPRFTFKKDEQHGYFPMKSEKGKDAKVADLKEFYHYFGNRNQDLPPLPVDLEPDTQMAFKELENLAIHLLNIIENATPKDVNTCDRSWSESVNKSESTLLRILHYPPLGPDAEEGAVRAAAHEDINFITLLPAATQPGLEVKDLDGNWLAVDVKDSNSIIVNVGDMLQEATGGYFKSTTHRVVNPEGSNNVSRFSMPLFLHPHGETRLSQRHTAHSYLMERLKELGLI